jgi:hypothetical protein
VLVNRRKPECSISIVVRSWSNASIKGVFRPGVMNAALSFKENFAKVAVGPKPLPDISVKYTGIFV